MNPVSDRAARAARRLGLRAAFGLALLCALPALAADKLVLAVSRSPLSLPLYVAQERHYFADEGVEAALIDCIGGHRCLRQVLEGHADVATAGELPVVFNGFERSDYAVVATLVTAADDVKLIAHARAGIARARQLAGKRVGLTPGTAGHYFLDSFLLTAGVDPRSIVVVGLQPEQLQAALQAGEVDAIVAWEPYAYRAVKALAAQATVLPGSGSFLQTFNLVAGRAQLQSRHDALVRLLRAVERAERYIAERPAEAQAILRRRLQMEPAAVDAVWPGLSFRLRLDQSLITTMEGEARWAIREGHVKARSAPNFLPLVHPAPLQAVNPAAVSVAR